jgi:hypothetical protein
VREAPLAPEARAADGGVVAARLGGSPCFVAGGGLIDPYPRHEDATLNGAPYLNQRTRSSITAWK